jgi:hypothetical protein
MNKSAFRLAFLLFPLAIGFLIFLIIPANNLVLSQRLLYNESALSKQHLPLLSDGFSGNVTRNPSQDGVSKRAAALKSEISMLLQRLQQAKRTLESLDEDKYAEEYSDARNSLLGSSSPMKPDALRADHSRFRSAEFKNLRARAEKYYGRNNTYTPTILGLLAELVVRRSPHWFASTRGLYIADAVTLERRLREAGRKFSIDCRGRTNILLFGCLITKYDDLDLQEWLVWQILITGVHHIIVYLNGPEADYTPLVLQPFVDAGYVTAINMTGAGKQGASYSHCLNLIRRKACRYSGKGTLTASDDCPRGTQLDTYEGKNRPVWVHAFDSDEFTVDTSHGCAVDYLANNFSSVPDYNGLMMPWMCFGHSGQFLSPENQLVTEAYTNRMGEHIIGARPPCTRIKCPCMGKAFNRVSRIHRLTNSHVAQFKHNGKTVSEYYEPVESFYARPEYNKTHQPRLRLHHYMTKSVEHLMKKFLRGVADAQDEWGKAPPRELSQIYEWLHGFTYDWLTEDRSALPMAEVVRSVLTGL